MAAPRYSFASCVSSSTGLIYVAGGAGGYSNPLATAETYNVEEDKWEILTAMTQPRSLGCQAVFIEGKFMVISGNQLGRSAEVFDPTARTWRSCEDMWISFKGNPWGSWEVATSSTDLYVFVQRDVMKYNAEKNVWTAVATLPLDIHSGARVAQWRDSVFVSGYNTIRHKRVNYLLNPSTGQLIEVNRDGGEDIVRSPAIISIEMVEI